MAVTLKITDCLALAVVLLLALCHNIWASFFSDSTVIIKDFAYMTPLLVASILLDSTQGVLSCINDPYPPHRSLFISPFCLDVTDFCWSMGGKRMWQHMANLATFYLIGNGMPFPRSTVVKCTTVPEKRSFLLLLRRFEPQRFRVQPTYHSGKLTLII